MLKLTDNPPMGTYIGSKSITESPGTWWVAHTKARFEKAFAWDLVNRQIGYFLPMVQRTRISGGRKRHVMLPLFSSYVFICGDESIVHQAKMTNRLCQIINVPDQKTLIDELATIENALTGDAEVGLSPRPAMGKRCRIVNGALKGLEGAIVQRDRLVQIVLQVSILGQSALVEIEPDRVEMVE